MAESLLELGKSDASAGRCASDQIIDVSRRAMRSCHDCRVLRQERLLEAGAVPGGRQVRDGAEEMSVS